MRKWPLLKLLGLLLTILPTLRPSFAYSATNSSAEEALNRELESRNVPNYEREYARTLFKQGKADMAGLLRLQSGGVEFLQAIYYYEEWPTLSTEEIIKLKENNINSVVMKQVKAAWGTELGPADLIKLKKQGIGLDLVANFRLGFGREGTLDNLLKVHDAGLSLSYVNRIREGSKGADGSGRTGMTVNDFLRLKKENISLFELLDLFPHWKGISLQEILELKEKEVNFFYAGRMKEAFGDAFDLNTVDRLEENDVYPSDYYGAAMLKKSMEKDQSAKFGMDELIKFAKDLENSENHHTSVKYVGDMLEKLQGGREGEIKGLTPAKIISFMKKGGKTDIIVNLKDVDKNLNFEQVMDFMKTGALSTDLSRVKFLKLDEIIQLLKEGLELRTMEKMKKRWPETSFDELLSFSKGRTADCLGSPFKLLSLLGRADELQEQRKGLTPSDTPLKLSLLRKVNEELMELGPLEAHRESLSQITKHLQTTGEICRLYDQIFLADKEALMGGGPADHETPEVSCPRPPMIPKDIETFTDLVNAFTRNLLPDLKNPTEERAFDLYRLTRFGNPTYELPDRMMDRIRKVHEEFPNLGKRPLREVQVTFNDVNYPRYDKAMAPVLAEWRKLWDTYASFDPVRFPGGMNKVMCEKIFSAIINCSDLKSLKTPEAKKLRKDMTFSDVWARGKEALGQELAPADREAIMRLMRPMATLKVLQEESFLKRHDGMRAVERMPLLESFNSKINNSLRDIGQPTEATLANAILQAKAEKIVRPEAMEVVRPLSFMECPYRGAAGNDCSSNTYMEMAMQENYHYFTLTDKDGYSQGQLTLVLGEASGKKIAFLDKIQNIPDHKIESTLEAVRRSLAQEGYQVAVPTDMGDHNGISNEEGTRLFLQNNVKGLSTQGEILTGFRPEDAKAVRTLGDTAHSRAYDELPIKVLLPHGGDGIDLSLAKSPLPAWRLKGGPPVAPTASEEAVPSIGRSKSVEPSLLPALKGPAKGRGTPSPKMGSAVPILPPIKGGSIAASVKARPVKEKSPPAKAPPKVFKINMEKILQDISLLKDAPGTKERLNYLFATEALIKMKEKVDEKKFLELLTSWAVRPETDAQLKYEIFTYYIRNDKIDELKENWQYLDLKDKNNLINMWEQSPRYTSIVDKIR